MGIGAAIGAAIFTAGSAAAAITAFAVNTVVSLALGSLASALAPKPKTANLSGGFTAKASGLTQNINQPITPRRILYGEARVGGALTFIETTNDDQFMHIILTLCDHEIEHIGEIWFNGVSIPEDAFDNDGNVISGDYANRARIKRYLGTVDQTVDPDLLAETSVDQTFRGRNIAYIYARLEFDRDVFPSSVPVITAWVKGRKIYDPRDNVERWTNNGALFPYDYLTLPPNGLITGVGAAREDIDETCIIASANVSDEIVPTAEIVQNINGVDINSGILTVPGVNNRLPFQTGDRVTVSGSGLPSGLATSTNYFIIPYQRNDNPRVKLADSLENALAGVAVNLGSAGSGSAIIRKNGEPRYTGGGVVETSEDSKSVIEDLLTTTGGSAVYVGGKWIIKAASYHTPVYEFNESHLTSPITVRTKVGRRERFNLIKGVYVSPLNDGEPADYPVVENSFYQNQDGEILPIDFDLPLTQRASTAQRLAKIKLEKHRQELFFEASFKLHAMQVQPADIVYISNERMGWSSKPFEVVTWSLTSEKVDNVPLYSVRMALQETASSVYDWNNGEETLVDPAPDTNLPNPLRVAPPTGLAAIPREIRTASGDLTFEFDITWSPPNDIFVVNGGRYEVEFKKSNELQFRSSYDAKDNDELITVKQIEGGVNYDTRVRSVNNLGVRSQWANLFGFNVTSPSGATLRFDDGFITDEPIEFIDEGLITDGIVQTIDEGTL